MTAAPLNVEFEECSLDWVVQRRWFRHGFRDWLAGRPPSPAYDSWPGDRQCLYEAGRLFGASYGSEIREHSLPLLEALELACADGTFPSVAF